MIKFRLCLFHLVTIIIFLMCFVSLLPAKQSDATHSPYDYAQTTANLLKQEDSGVLNADLFNQLGLSFYHQGNNGKAALYFLRALRLNSNHKDAKNNLEFVISRSLDRELYSPSSFLSGIFQTVFDFFSLNALAVIVTLLLIMTVICLHWLLHFNKDNDKIIPIMWITIFGFVFLLSAILLGFKYRDFNNTNKAVIISAEAEGFSGPGNEFGKIFSIHSGLIIHISRIEKEWSLITLPNGGAGWIKTATFERVKSQ